MHIRGLSLTQPWATLMALGEKKIETRSWVSPYRGWLAIHASKGLPRWAQETCTEPYFRDYVADARRLPRGSILALAHLFDIYTTSAVRESVYAQERAFGDYSPGRYAWMFGRVICLATPVPCKGALGLWVLPDAINADMLAIIAESNEGGDARHE